jgi:hypothetical protein
MTEPLQEFGWKDSNYERPAQSWTCGRLCAGDLCRFGPSDRGRCQVQSRCEPEKDGDRYQCTRSAANGGKCKDGPLPDGQCRQPDLSCQPKRSLIAERRHLGFLCAAVAVAYGLVAFSGPQPSPSLSPGSTSSSHAFIENNCAKCHSAADGGLSNWIRCALSDDIALTDSKRCLKCHHELGANALLAHGLPTDQLLELIRRAGHAEKAAPTERPLSLAFSGKIMNFDHTDQLACANCHGEHHGRDFDARHLTDHRCQTCHTRAFESFSEGHPQFDSYPYKRRTRIYFDHATHLQKHFHAGEFDRLMPDGKPLTSCNSCHQPTADGRTMRTLGFKAMCASCHESQIVDAEFPGMPFFALPDLGLGQNLKDDEPSPIGHWPPLREGVGLAKLPPFMELLLRDDSEFQSAMVFLLDTDLRRKFTDNKAQRDAKIKLAWAVKSLLADVSRDGQAALVKRLGPELGQLSKAGPSIVPTMQEAGRLWFPDLDAEVKAHRADQPLPTSEKSNEKTDEKPLVTSNADRRDVGWFLNHADLTIRYRPVAHADPVLRTLLDIQTQKPVSDVLIEMDSAPLDLLANIRFYDIVASPTASGTAGTNGPVASGRCLTCHTGDRDPISGKAHINWHAFRAQAATRRATHFSHAPHVTATSSSDRNCKNCHRLESKGMNHQTWFRPEFLKREKSTGIWFHESKTATKCASGFAPIGKQNCANCHRKSQVGQRCLKCHNYHISH